MRFASMTSSAAVSSLWRPAASMKSWSGSSVPVRRRRSLGGRDGGADDHVALVEGGAERRNLVLGQVVLVGEGLQVALLDETAVGGLLEQAIGRRQVVQMRVSQWNLPLSVVRGPRRSRAPRPRRGGEPAMCRSAPLLYL